MLKNPTQSRLQAVIFDLDGTLLDTLVDIADSANRMLSAHGFSPHEVDAYRQFVGDGVRVLIQRILPAGRRDDATVAACLEAFRQEYGQSWDVATSPYPGVPPMLDELVSRGLKMAILSNKPDDLTKACVQRLLARWPFEAIMGQRDGTPRKPDPSAALEIARSTGIPAGSFFFVGDTGIDMQTALAAGMIPVGVLWGFRSRDELVRAGARVLLKQPGDLIALLDRLD